MTILFFILVNVRVFSESSYNKLNVIKSNVNAFD